MKKEYGVFFYNPLICYFKSASSHMFQAHLNVLYFLVFALSMGLSAQPEVAPWSNISGIRVDGELMELNSSLGLVGPTWTAVRKTAKERATYLYRRDGPTQFTNVSIDSFFYEQTVEDLGAGNATVRLQYQCQRDTQIIGMFFMLDLPASKYGDAKIQLVDPTPLTISTAVPSSGTELLRGAAKGIKVRSELRQLEVLINEGTEIVMRKNAQGDLEVYFALMTGYLIKGTSGYKIFTIHTSGLVDRSPVTISLENGPSGRPFKGFGGNFRLQNPQTDPPVIDYCLQNLPVRWGRVEMPWMFWHGDEKTNPLSAAREGKIHARADQAIRMAKRLDSLGMPVILSVWFPPDWAINGPRSWGRNPDGTYGNPLNPVKMQTIYQSIGDYLQYTKEKYGFEFVMFSFNEADLGINVFQSPAEHAAFIKGLGAHLKKRGLKTKLLLGDTADAHGWPFIQPALEDKSTHEYLGAVSFHSWRGYTDENLLHWRNAAETLKLPLLVGEGSMDAGAWRYPDIFAEETYAMEEINLYVRMLRLCQPESILQWQLTADYSPLWGGGVFGNHDVPLTPTQRFWNFKQLAQVPENLKALPISANKKTVECAALGDLEKIIYVIHLVNNGASRPMVIQGLPAEVQRLSMAVTNKKSNHSVRPQVMVRNGQASFSAPANSFITLEGHNTTAEGARF